MSKKFLREWISLDYKPDLLNESREKNDGKIILQGIIQKADVKNQNNRVYPRCILTREIENYQKAVRENRALGELDHPDSTTVSLKNVSHIMREMWWDGNNVRGKIEVLSTPQGKILESLLDSGVAIGISSRGVGSTEHVDEACERVQTDFQIICFDIVSEPSTFGAYLSEGKNITIDDVHLTKPDRIYRIINNILMR